MAGKLHKDYVKYNTGGGQFLSPFGKQKIAYAEGYNAAKAGALQTTNPHPAWQNTDQQSDWWAWDQGWRDKDGGYPPTHVG